jgi:hypothetical protein
MATPLNGPLSETPGLFDDVTEVRECRVAKANQLLAEGWALQGVCSWTQRRESKKGYQ